MLPERTESRNESHRSRNAMSPVYLGTSIGSLEIPAWIVDHASFLRWLRSGAIPDDARVSYINGRVWVETMAERAYAHNRLKTAVSAVLLPLVEDNQLGEFFGDGMTFTSVAGGITTVPDGVFASQASIDARRVELRGGEESEQDTELVGTPDLVIEVVSPSSVDKDTEWLMSRYHDAGIGEYWLVDGRGDPLRFTIYRRGPKGYVAVRRSDGWLRSPTFGRSFRFVSAGARMGGHPAYRFEMR
jgi:Uma2 family endonuclease